MTPVNDRVGGRNETLSDRGTLIMLAADPRALRDSGRPDLSTAPSATSGDSVLPGARVGFRLDEPHMAALVAVPEGALACRERGTDIHAFVTPRAGLL